MRPLNVEQRLRPVARMSVLRTLLRLSCLVSTLAACAPSHAAILDITKAPYYAVGDGTTDNTAAINQALADANAASPKNSVFVPAGQFAHSGTITDNNVVLYGTGASSVLVATNASTNCVYLKGTGPQLNTLKVTCPSASTRSNGSFDQIAVCPFEATNFQVRGIWVGDASTEGGQGAGILTYGGSNGLITGNYVYNTLADGIHTTDGASYITVTNNTVTNVGDDMIAVVSYQQDGTVDSHIVITDNHCVSQTNGRGISVVGGDQVVIANNRIDESWAAAIYLAGESSYATFSPTNVTVTNNVINNANQSTSTLHGSMIIFSDYSASPAQNITVQGNMMNDRLGWGINIGSNTSNIVLENNIVPYHFNTTLTYPLIPRNATGSCLEAIGSGTTNGTAVKLDQQNGASNQQWDFAPLGGTNWEIEPSYATSLALDVSGGAGTNGTPVDLYTYSGATRQQWSVGFVTGGFKFTPLNATSKVLDIAGGATANGTVVDIAAPTGATYQAFSLDTGTQIAAYPAAPTSLTASASGATQATLSWTASPMASSYNVYRGTASNSESLTPIATGVTSVSYADSGLTAGKTYYYLVASVNSTGTSGYSNEASATTSAAAPAAPTNLTATPGNAQVALAWTASSGATSYSVYRGTTAGGESTTAVATGITGTSYTNTGLTNGTTYYYKITAVNSTGASGYSNEAHAAPAAPAIPAAPTNLTATPGNAQVALSWTASSGATSYSVYRGTTAGGESTTAVATGVTGTSYTNTGLTNGTTYYYKITAVNSAGASGYSNEAHAAPSAPVGNPYGGTAAAVPGTVQAENYDLGGQGVAYNITSTNGTANSYRSDGVDLESCSDAGGGYDMGWTAAGQYFNYTVNVATAGTYTVSFRVSSGASGGTLHLQNAAGTNLSGTVTVPATGDWQTWTTVNATVTLPAGQQVLTVYQDSSGYNINYLTFAAVTAPAAPTGLTATPGNAQVALAWTASSGAASYSVYRGTTAGGESTTAVATGVTSTSYTNTGLTNGTAYYYKVKAVNGAGASGYSNEASATPSASASGSLSGTETTISSSQAFNLTSLGTTDWTAWGNGTFEHSASGGSKISNISIYNGGDEDSFYSGYLGFTWTNGTPDASMTNEQNGYYNDGGAGDGFSFTAPASLTTQTLTVFVGGFDAGGTMTASLSDGSAAAYTNTFPWSSSGGSYYTYYTLTYKAASAGTTLTVKWTAASGGGNVTIYAAALH